MDTYEQRVAFWNGGGFGSLLGEGSVHTREANEYTVVKTSSISPDT